VISLRQSLVLVAGVAISLAGVRLRWSAWDLAWSGVTGYSGPRTDTVHAFAQRTYEDLGLMTLLFGLALILAVVVLWLSDGRPARWRDDGSPDPGPPRRPLLQSTLSRQA
jgi:hypothetical protein